MVTNVRSLLHKYDEAFIAVTENDVELFAATETWLSSQVPGGVINITSFHLIRKHRTDDRRGEVFCCYAKNDIKCSHLGELESDDFEVL